MINIVEAIKLLTENQSLTQRQAYEVCLEIMEGNVTPAQIGALLTGLRMKGEDVDEITGFARAMREKMIRIDCASKNLVDTCGTGGDGAHTFNVSTAAAFIAAGAGCSVAKHGNRSVSSLCGSADLVSALKIRIDLNADALKNCIEDIGIGFLFAPLFHPAMKFASGPRKEMGIRTIFNLIGPLCNPAGVQRQVIGVCQKEFVNKIAETLRNFGVQHSLVFYGADGLDEITVTTKTYVKEVKDGNISCYELIPEEFGFKTCSIEELKVKNSQDNLDAFMAILNGASGPKTDMAIFNAGAVIYVAGKAGSIKEGIELAKKSVFTGLALKKVEELLRYTNECAQKHNQI